MKAKQMQEDYLDSCCNHNNVVSTANVYKHYTFLKLSKLKTLLLNVASHFMLKSSKKKIQLSAEQEQDFENVRTGYKQQNIHPVLVMRAVKVYPISQKK